MGSWGPGGFENDGAMDWVGELRRSEDPGYPLAVLRNLDGVGPLARRSAEIGIAAAEAFAASRGWPAEGVPAACLSGSGLAAPGRTGRQRSLPSG